MINKRKTNRKKSQKSENIVVRIICIALIIISLGIMIGVIGYTLNKNIQHHNKLIVSSVINTSIEAVNYPVMGLNADRNSLSYGKATIGNSGIRYINISTKEKAIVKIYISGEMINFVSVDKPEFIMEAGTNMKVPFYLDLPKNMTPGKYTGKIYIELLRP